MQQLQEGKQLGGLQLQGQDEEVEEPQQQPFLQVLHTDEQPRLQQPWMLKKQRLWQQEQSGHTQQQERYQPRQGTPQQQLQQQEQRQQQLQHDYQQIRLQQEQQQERYYYYNHQQGKQQQLHQQEDEDLFRPADPSRFCCVWQRCMRCLPFGDPTLLVQALMQQLDVAVEESLQQLAKRLHAKIPTFHLRFHEMLQHPAVKAVRLEAPHRRDVLVFAVWLDRFRILAPPAVCTCGHQGDLSSRLSSVCSSSSSSAAGPAAAESAAAEGQNAATAGAAGEAAAKDACSGSGAAGAERGAYAAQPLREAYSSRVASLQTKQQELQQQQQLQASLEARTGELLQQLIDRHREIVKLSTRLRCRAATAALRSRTSEHQCAEREEQQQRKGGTQQPQRRATASATKWDGFPELEAAEMRRSSALSAVKEIRRRCYRLASLASRVTGCALLSGETSSSLLLAPPDEQQQQSSHAAAAADAVPAATAASFLAAPVPGAAAASARPGLLPATPATEPATEVARRGKKVSRGMAAGRHLGGSSSNDSSPAGRFARDVSSTASKLKPTQQQQQVLCGLATSSTSRDLQQQLPASSAQHRFQPFSLYLRTNADYYGPAEAAAAEASATGAEEPFAAGREVTGAGGAEDATAAARAHYPAAATEDLQSRTLRRQKRWPAGGAASSAGVARTAGSAPEAAAAARAAEVDEAASFLADTGLLSARRMQAGGKTATHGLEQQVISAHSGSSAAPPPYGGESATACAEASSSTTSLRKPRKLQQQHPWQPLQQQESTQQQLQASQQHQSRRQWQPPSWHEEEEQQHAEVSPANSEEERRVSRELRLSSSGAAMRGSMSPIRTGAAASNCTPQHYGEQPQSPTASDAPGRAAAGNERGGKAAASTAGRGAEWSAAGEKVASRFLQAAAPEKVSLTPVATGKRQTKALGSPAAGDGVLQQQQDSRTRRTRRRSSSSGSESQPSAASPSRTGENSRGAAAGRSALIRDTVGSRYCWQSSSTHTPAAAGAGPAGGSAVAAAAAASGGDTQASPGRRSSAAADRHSSSSEERNGPGNESDFLSVEAASEEEI